MFCLSCVLLFLIDFQTHVFGYPNTLFFTRGIKVLPVDLNAGTQLVSLDKLLMSLRTKIPNFRFRFYECVTNGDTTQINLLKLFFGAYM